MIAEGMNHDRSYVDTAVRRVQEKYKKLARGRKIVDEFLAERREEAARE